MDGWLRGERARSKLYLIPVAVETNWLSLDPGADFAPKSSQSKE